MTAREERSSIINGVQENATMSQGPHTGTGVEDMGQETLPLTHREGCEFMISSSMRLDPTNVRRHVDVLTHEYSVHFMGTKYSRMGPQLISFSAFILISTTLVKLHDSSLQGSNAIVITKSKDRPINAC